MSRENKSDTLVSILYGFTISLCVDIMIPAYYFLAIKEKIITLSSVAFCVIVAIINVLMFLITLFCCRKESKSFGISYFVSCFLYVAFCFVLCKAGFLDVPVRKLLESGAMCISGINVALLLAYIAYETRKYFGVKPSDTDSQ